MKYYSRLKLYKASNVYFNPETCQAYSYNWWRFVDRIKGKVVFNGYTYSSSTSKHQSKVRSVLASKGIKIDFYIEAPRGLQDLDAALAYTYRQYFEAKAKLLNPKRLKKLDAEKKRDVLYYKERIKEIKYLGGRIDLERIKSIAETVENSAVDSFLYKQARQADLESISRRIILNGDGMVNLKREGLDFKHHGLDAWSVDVSPLQEVEFFKSNGLYKGYGDISSYEDGQRVVWGKTETIPLNQVGA
jgi:hypothetical protein